MTRFLLVVFLTLASMFDARMFPGRVGAIRAAQRNANKRRVVASHPNRGSSVPTREPARNMWSTAAWPEHHAVPATRDRTRRDPVSEIPVVRRGTETDGSNGPTTDRRVERPKNQPLLNPTNNDCGIKRDGGWKWGSCLCGGKLPDEERDE